MVDVPRPPRPPYIPPDIARSWPDVTRWTQDTNDWLNLIWQRSGGGTDLVGSAQPADADLTIISGQTNAAYGLSLLTLASAAALRTSADVYSTAGANAAFDANGAAAAAQAAAIAASQPLDADLTTLAATFVSGTYTPTLFNTTNVAASTAYVCQYIRVGDIVFVSGRVDIDVTAAGADTVMGMSLPIASNIGAVQDLGGSAVSRSTAVSTYAITGDAANDRASILGFASGSIANIGYGFLFMYRVI